MLFKKKCLSLKTFPRKDYLELIKLVLVWLGEDVENFKFQKPGATCYARYMAKAIYYMKM